MEQRYVHFHYDAVGVAGKDAGIAVVAVMLNCRSMLAAAQCASVNKHRLLPSRVRRTAVFDDIYRLALSEHSVKNFGIKSIGVTRVFIEVARSDGGATPFSLEGARGCGSALRFRRLGNPAPALVEPQNSFAAANTVDLAHNRSFLSLCFYFKNNIIKDSVNSALKGKSCVISWV